MSVLTVEAVCLSITLAHSQNATWHSSPKDHHLHNKFHISKVMDWHYSLNSHPFHGNMLSQHTHTIVRTRRWNFSSITTLLISMTTANCPILYRKWYHFNTGTWICKFSENRSKRRSIITTFSLQAAGWWLWRTLQCSAVTCGLCVLYHETFSRGS
jgi:hypothetical protein